MNHCAGHVKFGLGIRFECTCILCGNAFGVSVRVIATMCKIGIRKNKYRRCA
jgi:hypothetical protein